MSTFELVLLMLLVVDAIALAGLVLLQQGRGADVGAAFGSGSANTMFGSSGSASFLTKLTVWLAIGFFLISFGLAWTAKERAADLGSVGVPQIQTPAVEVPVTDNDSAGDAARSDNAEQAADDAAGRLTPEGERVDSDIPDV